MPTLTVSPDGTHLQRDGVFFPYVVDTAWSVFADAGEDEWVWYLDRRRAQGFTSVAISILPILHDRTVHPAAREPFAVDPDGHYDLDSPDPDYFAYARRLVARAAERDLVPTLVVLWCNYAPQTWGARLTPEAVMSDAQRRAYVSRVATTFAEYGPVFAVSGDDAFTDATSIAAYADVRAQLAAEAPGCLLTAHSTPGAVLPDDFADSLDLFVYQSGHDPDRQDRCHLLAAQYRSGPVRKPVVNLEPAYEQHGFGRGGGRFTAAEVRRAVWWSVLGGASAGVGYGAHGVWQWFRDGGSFTAAGSSLQPFGWQTAMGFRGADDVALLAHLLRVHRLDRLDADQPLLDAQPTEVGERVVAAGVRAASSADGDLVAVYLPFAHEVRVGRDLTGCQLTGWDLDRRTPVTVRATAQDGGTVLGQPDVAGDVLVIAERRR